MLKRPVIAAIPNYNMGPQLELLLPEVLEQEYDEVIVLDDASTDDSVGIVESFGREVSLIRAKENQGAGANRNQIIEFVDDYALIHFVDADMELMTQQTPEIAREVIKKYEEDNVGVVAGLVKRPSGSQEPYNFGPSFKLSTNLTAGLPILVDNLRNKHPSLAKKVQRIGRVVMQDWPDVLNDPQPRETFWSHEGNMLIYAAIFKKLNGYDPKMRAHETQDLSLRLAQLGIKTQFDPAIKVLHHMVDVRGDSRNNEQLKAMIYLFKKYGLKSYITGKVDQIEPRFNVSNIP